MALRADLRRLVCPKTRLPLRECAVAAAAAALGLDSARMVPRPGGAIPAGSPMPTVLLRSDDGCAFPIIDGLPVLLGPEMFLPEGGSRAPTTEPQYAEAYDEMAFYNQEAKDALATAHLPGAHSMDKALTATAEQRASFPAPHEIWLDVVYDCVSEWDAYRHLAPLAGKRVLQIGGKGTHAVK